MRPKKCGICGNSDYPIVRQDRCALCNCQWIESKYIERNPGKIISISSNYLFEEYVVKGRSLREIGSDKGLSSTAVLYWLRYYEIPSRSRKTLIRKINSSFFSQINPDSAFLLGYIFTDGDLQYNHITGKYFLRLYSKFKENLSMVLKLIESEAIIQHRKEVFTETIRQGELYFIHVADERIISDLIGLGMVQNKNNNIQFPDIPEKMISHFIRGCWAGSGCVYFSKQGRITSRFTSGSLKMISRIEQELNVSGMGKRKIYQHKHTKSPSYYITYAIADSLKLYRYLYRDAQSKNSIIRQTEAFEKQFKNPLMHN